MDFWLFSVSVSCVLFSINCYPVLSCSYRAVRPYLPSECPCSAFWIFAVVWWKISTSFFCFNFRAKRKEPRFVQYAAHAFYPAYISEGKNIPSIYRVTLRPKVKPLIEMFLICLQSKTLLHKKTPSYTTRFREHLTGQKIKFPEFFCANKKSLYISTSLWGQNRILLNKNSLEKSKPPSSFYTARRFTAPQLRAKLARSCRVWGGFPNKRFSKFWRRKNYWKSASVYTLALLAEFMPTSA